MFDSLTQNTATENGLVTVRNTLTKQVEKIAFATSIQIGLNSYPTELQVIGRVSLNPIDIKVSKSSYDLENNAVVYNIDTSEANVSSVTLNLSGTPRLGQLVSIKDIAGRAATIPIVVKGYQQNHLIDGQLSRTLETNYESLTLLWQGSMWTISNKFSSLYTIASFTGDGFIRPPAFPVVGTISSEADFVKINSTSGDFTLNLDPNPRPGKHLVVKDASGTTTTNNVILSGNGKTIDGSPSVTFNTNYMSISLVYNGSEWSII